jgi:AraC-like DNA-binding protein
MTLSQHSNSAQRVYVRWSKARAAGSLVHLLELRSCKQNRSDLFTTGEFTMDVLSNVLKVTNLATHVLGSREFIAPWGITIDAQAHAAVHMVKRGSCWLKQGDGQVVRLNAGDVVLLARGDGHALSSNRLMRNLEPYREAIVRSQAFAVHPRDSDPDASIESTLLQSAGYVFSQDTAHPLLSLLPPVIRIPADQANSDNDLQILLRLIGQEIGRRDAGSELVVPRLIDSLFVYVVRAWLRDQPEGAGGWLGALRDPQIRKALSQIHESPQAPWTVESLARSVAMSRAAFAKRFADLVGEPPLAYVTRWRMDLAAKLLRESGESVSRIAGRVGYISETAFAKAFRRRRKVAPGQYRYRRAAAEIAAAEINVT